MSWRAVGIGVVGIVAVCWAVSAAELTYLKSGFLQLPPATLVMLAILLGIRRLTRSRGLTAGETAILYCAFLLAALVASRGLMEKLIPALIAPHYYSKPPNHWVEDFFPHLPAWAVPFKLHGPVSQRVSEAYFEGLHPGESLPWMDWFRPMAAWSILVAFVFGAFLCLGVLLRRQWVDNERLAFPLVTLPLELIGGDAAASRWSRPLLWLGFAIPAAIFSLNSLQAWYPSLPSVPLQPFAVNDLFTSPPLKTLAWTPVFFSFAEVGLLYFVPLDLLFSLWFFFLFARVQEGIADVFGYQARDLPLFPCRAFIGYQAMGAYFVLAIGLIRGLAPRWWRAVRGSYRAQAAAGPVAAPRAALAGMVVCLVGMTAWSHALGLSVGWALAEWLIFLFVVSLVLARSVAEGGMMMTEVSFRPVDVYTLFAAPRGLGAGNMAGMAMLDAVWFRDQRGMVFTGILDSLKIGSARNLNLRSFLFCLCGALVLAAVCSAVAQIWLPYHLGAMNFYGYLVSGNPIWGFQDYSRDLRETVAYDWSSPINFGAGASVTLLLILLRTSFTGWPLVPLGYALCGSWTMILMWFPCLFTWVTKGLILRYGGKPVYQRLRPFFLGLIVGEFSMFVFWTVASAILRVSAPSFPWP